MDRLRRYLKDRGISQVAFAERLRVKQPTVSDWVTGESLPSAETLKEISTVTGISIDELLDHHPRRRASDPRPSAS